MSTKSASTDSANHELASNDSTSYKLKVKQDLCARESNASETYQKRDQENLTLLRSYIHFVPFMAKLLSGQKPAHHIETEEILRHSKSLVNADLLCQEALESLKEMITEVIFDQLTIIGAEKKRYANVRHRTVQISRMWQQADWHKLSLQFTDHSIDLAIYIYQYYHASTKQQQNSILKRLPNLSTPSPGDLLFQFVIYQHLVRLKTQAVVKSAQVSKNDLKSNTSKPNTSNNSQSNHNKAKAKRPSPSLTQKITQIPTDLSPIIAYVHEFNPLIYLVNIDKGVLRAKLDMSKEYHFDFKVLKASEYRILWPWFSTLLVNAWQDSERFRWAVQSRADAKHTRFYNYSKQQSALIGQLIDFAEQEERFDLLLPLLDYYQDLYKNHDQGKNSVKSKVDMVCSELRLVNRPPILTPFVAVLNAFNRLAAIAQKINQNHPMDREWSEILFLSVFQAAELESATIRINKIIDEIDPSIG